MAKLLSNTKRLYRKFRLGTTPEVMHESFCPRCDKNYLGDTKEAANAAVRAHIARQIDELHEGALDEWDDE